MASPPPLYQSSPTANIVDRVALSADTAIHATQAVTNKAFDRLSGSVEAARERAHPLADKLALRAERASGYVQGQPLKSLLIAAATGAAVVTVLSWLTRSRSRY
jgi:ElaB/YqjD/DUF883 family membrane-anchored ribosome-binding protein